MRLRRQTVKIKLRTHPCCVEYDERRAFTRRGAKRIAGREIVENHHRYNVEIEIWQSWSWYFGIDPVPFKWQWFPRSPHQQRVFETRQS